MFSFGKYDVLNPTKPVHQLIPEILLLTGEGRNHRILGHVCRDGHARIGRVEITAVVRAGVATFAASNPEVAEVEVVRAGVATFAASNPEAAEVEAVGPASLAVRRLGTQKRPRWKWSGWRRYCTAASEPRSGRGGSGQGRRRYVRRLEPVKGSGQAAVRAARIRRAEWSWST